MSRDFSLESLFHSEYLLSGYSAYPDYLHPAYPLNASEAPSASL
jgi:hypothetical protein